MYCIFAFNKNYEYLGKQSSNSNDDSSESSNSESNKIYRTFTYDWIFSKICELLEEESDQYIKKMVEWKLSHSYENVLQSLLKHRKDKIAAEFAFTYFETSGSNLLIYSMENGNEYFLKQAIRNSFF